MDERVAMAISHWSPRFTTNGVTAGDFERITAGLERWAEWCAACGEVAAEHEQLGRDALAAGREMSAGAHLSRAAVYYHFAKFLFVEDPGQMRAAHLAAVRCLTDALPFLDPPGRRIEIPFDGVVIMIPGPDYTTEEFRSTEELFLARGVATFSVDGPGQGEAEYDLAIRGDWEVPGAAIIDRLSVEATLDEDRIAVWGVSLGGYYAPRVASGDARVRLRGPGRAVQLRRPVGQPAGRGDQRPRRAAAAGEGQPRLRQPGAVSPLPDRRLGRRATRRAGQASRGGLRMSGRA
jgi:hypothetical protein